jgi:P4 family phage/plasmid primase-like protien
LTPLEGFELGWSLIPCGTDKKPAFDLLRREPDGKRSWKPYQTERASAEEFLRWLEANPPAFAIVTGAVSRRIAIDFDGEQGRALANAWGARPHRRTGSGGFHWDIQHPGFSVPTLNGKTTAELAERWPGLDVKGDGGYVIAFGRNESGPYDWLRGPEADSPDLLQDALWDMLRIRRNASSQGTDKQTPHAPAVPDFACDWEPLVLAALDRMRRSGRNNGGFWLAIQLRHSGYGASETEHVLGRYASRCPSFNLKGQPEPYTASEITATVRSVFSRPTREALPQTVHRERQLQRGATLAPEPEFDVKRRLSAPAPTIGNELLVESSFARSVGERLHIFEDGAYRDHGALVVRETSRKLMQSWGTLKQWKKHLADEVLEWVLLASPTLWEKPPIDRINLRNGIYNLSNSTLEPHTPDWLSPVQLPVFFDPDADCPGWDEFLAAVLPSDVCREQITFQLAALLMIPYTSAQKALLLLGPRGTGKSRFLAAIRAFLGAENTSSKSLHSLEDNRFASAYLDGKLANICPDLPNRHLESTSTFKAITGEDHIDAEYKHGQQFQLKPFSRLLFSTNQPPESKDTSDAFLDRWWIIPFTQRFQDSSRQIASEDLDSRLSDPRELSGVLNRALKWLPHVLEHNGITQTTTMKEAHDEFCAATDPFRVWMSEFIIDDPDSVAPCDDVLKSYIWFRKTRGLPPVTSTAFGLELRKHKRKIQRKERTVQRRDGFSTCHCYVGIRLVPIGATER